MAYSNTVEQKIEIHYVHFSNLPVSFKFRSAAESTSTDFDFNGNCSESIFGFTDGSISDFGLQDAISPFILCSKVK